MKKAKAFSVLELLIVFTIIGVITTLGVTTLRKTKNNYGPSYYNAYSTLKKVSYNILADPYCSDNSLAETGCPRFFPSNANDMCYRLIEFINASKEYCSSYTPLNAEYARPDTNSFDDSHLAFTATNGQKYYISNVYAMYADGTVADKCTPPGSSGNDISSCYTKGTLTTSQKNHAFAYYVVYVDLNGSKKPNRIQKKGILLPDIVPFILTSKGDAIPVGNPAYSLNYLSVKIKYPDYYYQNNRLIQRSGSELYSKKSYTLQEAVSRAYGEHPNIDMPYSFVYRSEINNYNLDFGDGKRPAVDENCEEGTTACRIIIDSYAFRRY